MRAPVLALCVAVCLCGIFAATAVQAKQTHQFIANFNLQQQKPYVSDVAVDYSTGPNAGDVYLTDQPFDTRGSSGVVERFSPEGIYEAEINGSETMHGSFGRSLDDAVDPVTGDVYVSESEESNRAVYKFGVSGKLEKTFGGEGEGQISAVNIGAGELGSPGTGQSFNPTGVAVDPESGLEHGDLYVSDSDNNVIDVFTAAGVFVRQFPLAGKGVKLAFDSQGNVFAAEKDEVKDEVSVYVAATGVLNSAYGAGTGVLRTGATQTAVTTAGDILGVGVDPANGDVYVTERFIFAEHTRSNVTQYDAAGEEVATFQTINPVGVAVSRSGSRVYVAEQDSGAKVFGPQVTFPGVKSEPASGVSVASAVLNGVVAPEGVALKSGSSEGCFFEYGTSEAYGSKAPCEAPDAAQVGSSTSDVHAKIALMPGMAYDFRLVAANENGTEYGANEQIQLPSADADEVHSIDGEGKLSVFGVVNPDGSTAKYRFEFISEARFAEGEDWSGAVSTPEVQTSVSGPVVGDVPSLAPGAYRFRLSAIGSVYPEVQEVSAVETLVVPVSEPESPQGSCPDEAERTGASARLPDCRAYEQVTPVNKGGAQDNFDYSKALTETIVGLDGEHVVMETPSKWGESVTGNEGKTSYSFARTPEGWGMTSFSPQPQTGIESNRPYKFYTPDLSQALLERLWNTSVNAASPEVEYALGPPGGPYRKIASEPLGRNTRNAVQGEDEFTQLGHWGGQSRDGSVAVIESPDHELVKDHATGTTGPPHSSEENVLLGRDLYEYHAGKLSQINVAPEAQGGATIGTCGAVLVEGQEGGGDLATGSGKENKELSRMTGSVNAISENGSRIFFEAFPRGCPSSEEQVYRIDIDGAGSKSELYMRVDGTKTVDIGNYIFNGANPQGTRLLLSRHEGPNAVTFYSYDTETETAKRLFTSGRIGDKASISEDGNVFYFETNSAPSSENGGGGGIYRYDIPQEKLSFVAATLQYEGDGNGGYYTSSDGGEFYFNVESVPGVAGGVQNGEEDHVQVYRYDADENVVQCISCASSYDPKPRLLSTFLTEETQDGETLAPLESPASANGDFVFFDTPAALLPQDINGEIGPKEHDSLQFELSPSSDVYEWRRQGVDGCGVPQGCLALITTGIDGTENLLLGTDPSGRDVFFGTHSQLVSTDKDNSGDIYDARIGGGFPPPPPPPTECEPNSCSAPPPPPVDATPSSLTFSGPGNQAPPATGTTSKGASAKPKTRAPKKVRCARNKKRSVGKCVKKAGKARVGARRSGRSAGRGGR